MSKRMLIILLIVSAVLGIVMGILLAQSPTVDMCRTIPYMY